MKTNKAYIKPEMTVLGLESENGFLVGSITDVKIQPANVTVQAFEDGFSSNGGFKDLSFD